MKKIILSAFAMGALFATQASAQSYYPSYGTSYYGNSGYYTAPYRAPAGPYINIGSLDAQPAYSGIVPTSYRSGFSSGAYTVPSYTYSAPRYTSPAYTLPPYTYTAPNYNYVSAPYTLPQTSTYGYSPTYSYGSRPTSYVSPATTRTISYPYGSTGYTGTYGGYNCAC